MVRHPLTGLQLVVLSKAIRRYLSMTLPESASIATRDNAQIIRFLSRHEHEDIFQHDIERQFGITRSTASRGLALMEKKGLITRSAVEYDARLKKIALTEKARRIVNDLEANAMAMEDKLFEGFSPQETSELERYLHRLRANIEAAEHDLQGQSAMRNGE